MKLSSLSFLRYDKAWLWWWVGEEGCWLTVYLLSMVDVLRRTCPECSGLPVHRGRQDREGKGLSFLTYIYGWRFISLWPVCSLTRAQLFSGSNIGHHECPDVFNNTPLPTDTFPAIWQRCILWISTMLPLAKILTLHTLTRLLSLCVCERERHTHTTAVRDKAMKLETNLFIMSLAWKPWQSFMRV